MLPILGVSLFMNCLLNIVGIEKKIIVKLACSCLWIKIIILFTVWNYAITTKNRKEFRNPHINRIEIKLFDL